MSILIKKSLLTLVVMSGFLFMGALCSKNSSTNTATPVATNQISISNFAFNPSSITVVPGSTVTWKNNDSVTHTVTSDNGQFNMTLNPTQTYSFKFDNAGTFSYHCSIHTSMTGQVIVQ